MRTFTINGKEYKSRPFDFNTVCDMEEMGVSMFEMTKKQFSVIRAYFALCAGKGNDFAGKEIEAHFISGGNMNEISEALSEEMEKSDFFRALKKKAEEETGENQEEQTAETIARAE